VTRAAPPRQSPHKTLLLLSLLALPCLSLAQTPAARMMPDGSRDLYFGVGVSSTPRYQGAASRKTDPVALIQLQWSSGLFFSGLSAGMHLSAEPHLEFGPLLAIEPGRSTSGQGKLSEIGDVGGASIAAPVETEPARQLQFSEVPSRPVAGAFFNYYLDESLRVTSSMLYGSGQDRNGLLAGVGLQKGVAVAPHHKLSVTLGANWGNRRYHQAYFGVAGGQDKSIAGYAPSAGVRDLHLTFHWNWELSNLWLLTSRFSVYRLTGDAASSPLVERRSQVSVRTGLAYRF